MTRLHSRYFRDGQRVAAAVDVTYLPTVGVGPMTIAAGSVGVVVRRQRDRATYVVKWDEVAGWELETFAGHLIARPSVVLLFSNVARADLAARLHAPSCSMVHTSEGRGAVSRIDDPTAEDLADLNERGFAVKRCKCLPPEPKS